MKLKDAFSALQIKKNMKAYHQLYTKWGEQLDLDHVLEEYPRHQ
jgi:hypothetical protein